MSQPIAIGEAKTNLSKLIERAERGEEVIIRRGSEPVAKIIGYRDPERPEIFGSLEGRIRIGDDFDDPIPGFDAYQ